jgi:hypothetical protein
MAVSCKVVEVIDQRIRDNRKLCIDENCHEMSIMKRAKPRKNGILLKTEFLIRYNQQTFVPLNNMAIARNMRYIISCDCVIETCRLK